MKQSFTIQFDYTFNEIPITIQLQAKVTAQKTNPIYKVSDFTIAGNGSTGHALSEIEIEKRLVKGVTSWVHTDSKKETYLSILTGRCIDEHLQDSR